MLQRIQTVFLLGVVLTLIVTLFVPIWAETDPQTGASQEMRALYFNTIESTDTEKKVEYLPYMIVGILMIAAATVAVVEIVKYRNRMLQLRLGMLNSLFIGSAMLLMAYLMTQVAEPKWPETAGQFGLGLFLPAVAILCNMMAKRFIKRDEDLVKSVDRIR